MVTITLSLQEDYWENFELQPDDIEFLYNYLLETETPLTPDELLDVLIAERVRYEKRSIEQQRSAGGTLYTPKDHYKEAQKVIFPALGWQRGEVVGVRPGHNPDLGEFEVVKVAFADGEEREYAAGLAEHVLNNPLEIAEDDENLDPRWIVSQYHDRLIERIEAGLGENEDFVRIAGRWFPRALLLDVNAGHLNLAEAVLDMEGGGPLPTTALLDQLELARDVNPKLVEFSLDLALQEDERFDEVGPAGEVLWFLRRLEPQDVRETPLYLRYPKQEYDTELLSAEMLALEKDLDDELSPLDASGAQPDEVELRLIYPHWRAGTLPLASRIGHLFPTAYEAPRIRINFVDGATGEKFPAWVVRAGRYVSGLREWYEQNNLIPGSVVTVKHGAQPGEVLIFSGSKRSTREWVRTVLIGSDGGLVFAMLKQIVHTNYDERMVIAVPDVEAVDALWERMRKERPPFEKVVVNTVRELAKTNPQGHVHASELYAAMNVTRRCPPGPMLALLASRPWFVHVGDLHFRLSDTESK